MSEPKSTLKQKARQGLKEYLTIAGYLWVVFALFVLYKSVVLAEHHIPFAPQGVALLNALALAKVMMVAQHLHMGEKFKQAPLIYTTLFKSIAFAIVLGCFKMVEEVLKGLYHGKSLNESVHRIGGALEGILVLMTILTVVLIPYFAFMELDSILGKGSLRKLLFSPRHTAEGYRG
jgi:hypothetical protein